MIISICIPAYKARPFLPETLASVKSQTFSQWELILTEDGSDDGTAQIVDDFAKSVPQRVRYERHANNQGLPATRNTGMNSARGDLIAILDADDLWLPDHLTLCVEALKKEKADLAFSGCVIFDSDTGRTLAHRTPDLRDLPNIPTTLFTGKIVIQPSAVVLTREAARRIGPFNPKFPICNDFDYWLRACKAGCKFAYSGAETMRYRKHAGAMSKKSADLVAESGQVCLDNQHAVFGSRPHRIASVRKHFINAARMNLRSRPLLAIKQTAKALSIPIRISQ